MGDRFSETAGKVEPVDLLKFHRRTRRSHKEYPKSWSPPQAGPIYQVELMFSPCWGPRMLGHPMFVVKNYGLVTICR
jgi:hypothetical protein